MYVLNHPGSIYIYLFVCAPCCLVTASKPVMEAKRVGSVSVTIDRLNRLTVSHPKSYTYYLNSYKIRCYFNMSVKLIDHTTTNISNASETTKLSFLICYHNVFQASYLAPSLWKYVKFLPLSHFWWVVTAVANDVNCTHRHFFFQMFHTQA